MLKRISDWLQRVSSGWVTLCALVIFTLFTALVLPGQAARAETDAGDAGTPDLSFYYSVGDLYRMAEAYGEQGRAAYVRARFTFDVVWPLVYTAFLCTATSWVYGRAVRPGSRWRRANLAPLLAMCFDFLENLSTSLVMYRYPDKTAVVDALAPVFTMAKWVLVSGSFVLLLGGVVVIVWQWFRKRSNRAGL